MAFKGSTRDGKHITAILMQATLHCNFFLSPAKNISSTFGHGQWVNMGVLYGCYAEGIRGYLHIHKHLSTGEQCAGSADISQDGKVTDSTLLDARTSWVRYVYFGTEYHNSCVPTHGQCMDIGNALFRTWISFSIGSYYNFTGSQCHGSRQMDFYKPSTCL